jgi:hypothetical protein
MRCVGLWEPAEGRGARVGAAGTQKEYPMTPNSNRVPLPESRVSDAVIGALQASILVLAGIISLVQFAYY